MMPDRRWRPYIATGVLLLAAAGLNLAAGNRLWLGYTMVGLTGLLVATGLARWKGWFVPTRPAWLLGVTAAMHYGGGSMAGLHQVGGPNGLYFAFPWWDNFVHFVGSCAVAIAAGTFLAPRVTQRGLAWALSLSVAVSVGVGIELYEFAQFLWFGTVDQGYYTNTLYDLYNNVLGGALGAWLALRPDARVGTQRPQDEAATHPTHPGHQPDMAASASADPASPHAQAAEAMDAPPTRAPTPELPTHATPDPLARGEPVTPPSAA